MNNKTIVIFGSSQSAPESEGFLRAYQLGEALGEAGFTIANGGYGGTMAASAEGGKVAGTSTIGVTCEVFGRNGPNQWIDKEIRTDNLYQRLDTLIKLGDAYIVLPGGTGTLLELAACWELINKHFLAQVPIICLSGYWKPVVEAVAKSGEDYDLNISFAKTVQQALKILKEHFENKL